MLDEPSTHWDHEFSERGTFQHSPRIILEFIDS